MKFYTYVHKKPSGDVFYVGKGSGGRAWSLRHRSDRWARIVKKYGYEVEVVAAGLSEDAAFALEAELIERFGRDSLCNMTAGGDGISGWKHPESVRKLMAERRRGKKHSEETRAKIRSALIGRPSVHKGRELTDAHKAAVGAGVSGAANGRYDRTAYCFAHPDHGVIETTRGDLIKRFSLHHGALSRLVRGQASRVGRWTIEHCKD